MKRILFTLLLLASAFFAKTQTTNLFPYCNPQLDVVYNSINYLTLGSTTVNFGPLGDASNPSNNLYFNTTVLPDMLVGSTTPISINFYVAPDPELKYFALLIDYDQDDLFDIPSELILSNANTTNMALPTVSGAPVTINSNITIPAGALNGQTRMRLVRYSDFFGPNPLVYNPSMVYSDCVNFPPNFSFAIVYDFDLNIVSPTITVNPTILPAFPNTNVGNTSTNQSYVVSAINLNSNLVINAPSNYEISFTAGSGYGSSLSITPTSGNVPNTNIYVRFIPSTAGLLTGNITNASNGATTKNVAVSGTGIAPIIFAVPSTLTPFTAFVGYPSAPQNYVVSGTDLVGNINILAPAEFEISLTAVGGYGSGLALTPTAGNVPATTIYVRYNPGAIGVHTGNISNYTSGTGSNAINIPVTGTGSVPPPPTISVTPPTLLTFNTIVGNPSVPQTISVSGSYLFDDINISVPAPFEISLVAGSGYTQNIVLSMTAGFVSPTTIYVRFNPQIPNTYNADLTLVSLNAPDVVIPLTGIGAPNTPVVTLAPAAVNYFITTFGIPSAIQSIAVSGLYLISPLVINAPTHFQISTMPTSGFGSFIQLQPSITGAVPITTIYLRYNPLTSGNHLGYLTVTSNGAITKDMQLSGYAYPVSVQDFNQEDMYVYPIPCNNYVHISEKAKGADVTIFDINGRKISSYNNVEEGFNTEHLVSGVYVLRIEKEGLIYTSKLIKQ